MNPNTILRRATHVTFQVVADEAILIDMNSGTYFSLDEVGTAFWEMLDGSHTLAELAGKIAANYTAKAEKYVAELGQADTNQIETLAMEYGLEEDMVGEHLQRFSQGDTTQTAAQLVADFSVDPHTVLNDLVELVATMQGDNLVVVAQ